MTVNNDEDREALACIAASYLDKSDDFLLGMEQAHHELVTALYIRMNDPNLPMTPEVRAAHRMRAFFRHLREAFNSLFPGEDEFPWG